MAANGKAQRKEEEQVIAQNRKARHDYEVLETVEAGISLLGSEVKSCRARSVSLADSYVSPKKGEMLLIGAHIAPYTEANQFNHDPRRTRVLLLHKKEIGRLSRSVEAKGLTLIPLDFHFRRGNVKVTLGLCRGKNVRDKRDALRKKMDDRDMSRAMKRG